MNSAFLRLDSLGGASGDMLLGALISLGVPCEYIENELRKLLVNEKFKIKIHPKDEYGIHGICADVQIDKLNHHGHKHHKHEAQSHSHKHHNHEAHSYSEHHHRTFAHIKKMIADSGISEKSRSLAIKIFSVLAEAEGKIHNKKPEDVHFHEVGALDSIIDIVGSALALDYLNIEKIAIDHLPLGNGSVECQHGLMPLPAPATMEILKDIPVKKTNEQFEMVTPTGAAIIKALRMKNNFSVSARVLKNAYSFGHRKLSGRPNLLRASLMSDAENSSLEESIELSTNIDDMNPEILGNVFDMLLNEGAQDVYIIPSQMKKNRSGVILIVLCSAEKKKKMLELIFAETTTFGIREKKVKKHTLKRSTEKIDTSVGKITVKTGEWNGKKVTISPEYESCLNISRKKGIPLKKVYKICYSEI